MQPINPFIFYSQKVSRKSKPQQMRICRPQYYLTSDKIPQSATCDPNISEIMESFDKVKFWFAFAATQLFGASFVVLMIVWTTNYRKGFAWQENPGLQFNWHPLLMSIGLIYLYGNGMLIYRVLPNGKKSHSNGCTPQL